MEGVDPVGADWEGVDCNSKYLASTRIMYLNLLTDIFVRRRYSFFFTNKYHSIL